MLETTTEKEKIPGSPLVKTQNESVVDSSNKSVKTRDSEAQSTCDTNDEKTVIDTENKSDSGVSVDTQSDITKELETDTSVSAGDTSVSVERSENIQIISESSVIQERTRKQSDEKVVTASQIISLPKAKAENEMVKVSSPISPFSPHSPQFECSYEEDYMPSGKLNLRYGK